MHLIPISDPMGISGYNDKYFDWTSRFHASAVAYIIPLSSSSLLLVGYKPYGSMQASFFENLIQALNCPSIPSRQNSAGFFLNYFSSIGGNLGSVSHSISTTVITNPSLLLSVVDLSRDDQVSNGICTELSIIIPPSFGSSFNCQLHFPCILSPPSPFSLSVSCPPTPPAIIYTLTCTTNNTVIFAS